MTDSKASHQFQILVVDDEPADVHLIKSAIRDGHFLCDIWSARDGVEALDFLRKQGAKFQDMPTPDLVLLDLNMPRMDGRELLKIIREDAQLATIPVVVLTTSDVERDIASAYNLGASGFVTKPVDIDRLFAVIQGIEQYWFSIVRTPIKK